MRVPWGWVAAGLLLCAVGSPRPAAAGWAIEQVARGGGEPGRMHVFLQANRWKTVVLGPDGRPAFAFILDLGAETVAQVDYQGRRYAAATLAEYVQMMQGAQQAMAGQMAQALEQMREAMRDMPPEQRQMMEQMMRSQLGQAGQPSQDCREPRVEFRRTGQQATVAGYAAVRYDVLVDGRAASEVWLAPALTAWRELDPQKLERFAAQMATLASCGRGGPPRGLLGGEATWKLAAEGYPVRSVDRADGAAVEVVRAESRPIPAAEFQPPAGFARTPLGEMMGGR